MNYIAKRTVQAVFTVFAVMSLTFGLIRILPGGPTDFLRARLIQRGGLSRAQISQRIEALTNVNPDKPLFLQYVDYMTSILQGDFGTSTWYGEPVGSILFDAIPWTVFLMATSLFLTFAIGVILGAFMGYWEGSRFDVSSTVGSLVLNSTPYYVVALLFIAFLGYRWQLFPTGGRYASELSPGFTVAFISSVLYHGVLPIASLVITGFGGWALNMRGNSIRVLGEDYLRVARLRGLSESRIALRYVARNAILPMYTGLLIAIGGVFGGSIILEQIFSYPGVGYYMIRAIGQRDYPVMMGAFLIVTVAVVIGIYIADLTYGWVDPRVERGGSRESY